MLNILGFIVAFGIPGVITIVVNTALGWCFGIMGAIWLFAMLFLCINSHNERKWKRNHYEENTIRIFSQTFDVIAILVIIGIPVLALGFGIAF